MDSQFLTDRINTTKNQIVAYEDALTALAAGVQSYELDTGQTRQRVTRLDLTGLNKTLDSLYNRLSTLQARQNGGAVNIGAGW